MSVVQPFEEWYGRIHPRVIGVVFVACGQPDIASDATDEAFARALERWERIGAMASPDGWVCRVAINVMRRRLRRRADDCGPREFQVPEVDEGWVPSASGCTAEVAAPAVPGVDGLWIRPYQSVSPESAPAGAQALSTTGLQVLNIPDTALVRLQPVLRLLVRPAGNGSYLALDIGLGPDPTIASRILASLSTQPQIPVATSVPRPAPTTSSKP